MNPDEEVVAAEFKVNLLRPAVGPRLVAEATVLRAGRLLIVSQVTVSGFVHDVRVPVVAMIQTNCRVRDRGAENQGGSEDPPLRSLNRVR
jgi:acyl-coenzyme A thioesterase PaaI-like protein